MCIFIKKYIHTYAYRYPQIAALGRGPRVERRNFWICIFFFSLSINNRSLFFDNFLLIFFILLIYFQLGHYKVDKYFSFKVLIIIILSIPTLNFVDTLSKTYLLERSSLYERSPIQNFSSTFSRMLSYQDTKKK